MKNSNNTVIGLSALGKLTTLCRLKSTTALLRGEQDASRASPLVGQLPTEDHGGLPRPSGIPSHEQWLCSPGIPTSVYTDDETTFTHHQSEFLQLLEGLRPQQTWCRRTAKPACSLMAKGKTPAKLQTTINCALAFVRANGQSDTQEFDLQGRCERDSASTDDKQSARARKIGGPDLTLIRF